MHNTYMMLRKVEILRTLGISEIETSLALNEVIPHLLNTTNKEKSNQIIGYLKYESFYIKMSECVKSTKAFFENCTVIKRKGKKLFMREKMHQEEYRGFRQNSSYNADVRAKNYTTIPFNSYGFIYFLMKDKQVVYIGQTEQPASRIHGHSKKEFNCVCLFPCILENRNRLEVDLIRHFRPKYNKSHNPNYVRPKRKKKTSLKNKVV